MEKPKTNFYLVHPFRVYGLQFGPEPVVSTSPLPGKSWVENF
jgi:hypothetical protein